jgi:hypothetical protein
MRSVTYINVRDFYRTDISVGADIGVRAFFRADIGVRAFFRADIGVRAFFRGKKL